MPKTERQFVFSLTEDEVIALIELGAALDPFIMAVGPLATATGRLDEQFANQTRAWERCEACDGSGWVEDEPASKEEEAN